MQHCFFDMKLEVATAQLIPMVYFIEAGLIIVPSYRCHNMRATIANSLPGIFFIDAKRHFALYPIYVVKNRFTLSEKK